MCEMFIYIQMYVMKSVMIYVYTFALILHESIRIALTVRKYNVLSKLHVIWTCDDFLCVLLLNVHNCEVFFI